MPGSGPTDVEEKNILDARLDRVGALWLGLFTVMPADDGTGGTEVSGGSYARKAINVSTTEFAAADSTTAPTIKKGPTGATVWAFPAPTGNWGDIVGVGLFSASTSGTLLWVSQLSTTVTVNSGDPAPQFDSTHQITFQAGDPTDPFT